MKELSLKSTWAAFLVLAATVPACRLTDSGDEPGRGNVPEPTNRQEAARLEREGHSFEVAQSPAWVNDPRPAPTLPVGWTQVGRKKFRIGRAPTLTDEGDLRALLKKRAAAKAVRLRGTLERCGDIHFMRPAGKQSREMVLMVKTPLEDPRDLPGEVVVEGELIVAPKQLTHARLTCGAAHNSPALLVAQTVITSRRP